MSVNLGPLLENWANILYSTNKFLLKDIFNKLSFQQQKPTTKKAKNEIKPKETPVKPVKEAKTPRGKGKKEEAAKEEDDEKKEEEIVSRSGRKIRPKRYVMSTCF